MEKNKDTLGLKKKKVVGTYLVGVTENREYVCVCVCVRDLCFVILSMGNS